MFIDVNSPLRGGVSDINRIIGGYASPEAAQTDLEANAPQGTEYLRNQYQSLTGDAFADPFADASKARSSAMVDAALGGASIAVGGRMGSELLTAPNVFPVAQPAGRPRLMGQAGPPTTAGGMPMMAARDAAMTTYNGSTGPQPFVPQLNPLDRPELQLPASTEDENYKKIQQMRVSQVGGNAAALFQDYLHNQPSLLTPPVPHDQTLEYDNKGNPIAGDVLHKDLYNDPKFQSFLRTQPGEARGFYQSVTGRNYDADVHMQVAHDQSVTKRHTAAIDRFSEQGGSFDEEGVPYTTKLAKDPNDPMGGMVTTRNYDLSYETKQLLKNSTAYKTATGIDQPQPANMQGAGGPLSPDQEDKLRSEFISQKRQNPTKTDDDNMMLARRKLFGIGGPTPPSKFGGFVSGAGAIGRSILNPLIRRLNYSAPDALIPPEYHPQIPEIPAGTTLANLLPRFKGSKVASGISDEYGYLQDYLAELERNRQQVAAQHGQ